VTASTAGTPPATAPSVFEQVTEYRVAPCPLDDDNARHFVLVVRSRTAASGTWMVTDGAEPASYIGADGRWCWESLPEGDLPDNWRDAFRFDLDVALAIAREAAPKVVVNGGTWAQWQERHAARRLLGEEED
jgi:hypothetical protein